MSPFRDARSETDFGNVDAFVWDEGVYELSGDWGHVRIASDTPTVLEA
jgi:hypothetical protein